MKNLTTLIISLVFIILCGYQAYSQQQDNKNLTIAFYNVENLFDTSDDPVIRDDEFTPAGEKKWTPDRYTKKLNDIAKVLASVKDDGVPELIGLAEVENEKVLKDLIQSNPFKGNSYSLVHYNSPDERGIDVALLFNTNRFRLLKSRSFPIIFPFDRDVKVRDILYVKGYIHPDTLHIFVNHWKSRYGGKEETQEMRVYSARVLKSKTDSILNKNNNAKIVAIGDFNDEPLDKSLQQVLEAKTPGEKDHKLYNLLIEEDREGQGTYNYKYKWFMLDNFIVSESLLHAKKGYSIDTDDVHIHKPDWIMFDHPKAGMKIPNRTYGGPNYYGGYSDHLPVYGIFELQKEN